MSVAFLKVDGLGKAYRAFPSGWARFLSWWGVSSPGISERWAVRDVSFVLRSGESLALIGQNGAGKSTLLKMITGTIQPTEGAISRSGRISSILELGLGFNPEFSGRENIFQAGGLMGFSQEELRGLLTGIQDFSELGEYFDQPVRVYSSGMQARLAFSLATAVRPDILIVDEVLSVGDAYFQAKCFERLASFKEAGTSLLFVTHSMGDVVKHCDRAIFIKKGRAVFDGEPRDACNLYFDSLFGAKRPDRAEAAMLEAGSGEGDGELFHTRFGYRKEEHRWGQGGAKIIDYQISVGSDIYPKVIESTTKAKITFVAAFEEHHEDVTAGILIKTHDGVFLYGTNSFHATGGRRQVAVARGQRVAFTFDVPMMLNAGHYLISFGVSVGPQENLVPLERRYDSVLVTVSRPQEFWGIVDLAATFDFQELQTTGRSI